MPRRRIAKGAARSRAQIAAQQKAAEASARKRRKRGGDEPSARRAVARLDTNAPNNKKDLVALKEATKGGTAKGKVSLAASAKVGRENVINDADRIAYRAAAAESRKLKVTLGDNAPTADKIFSTAKKIAKIRAGDSEVKTADVKKASLSLDPDEKTPDVAKKIPLKDRSIVVGNQISKEELRKKINSLTPQDYADSRKRVLSERAKKGAATRADKRSKSSNEGGSTKKPVSERSLAQLKDRSIVGEDPDRIARRDAARAEKAKMQADDDAKREARKSDPDLISGRPKPIPDSLSYQAFAKHADWKAAYRSGDVAAEKKVLQNFIKKTTEEKRRTPTTTHNGQPIQGPGYSMMISDAKKRLAELATPMRGQVLNPDTKNFEQDNLKDVSLAELKRRRESASGGPKKAAIVDEIERREAAKVKSKNREGSIRGRLVSRDVNNESKAQVAAHNAGQSPFVKVNGETLTPAQKKTFDEIVKTHGKDQGALIDFARSKNGTLRQALMNEAQKVGDADRAAEKAAPNKSEAVAKWSAYDETQLGDKKWSRDTSDADKAAITANQNARPENKAIVSRWRSEGLSGEARLLARSLGREDIFERDLRGEGSFDIKPEHMSERERVQHTIDGIELYISEEAEYNGENDPKVIAMRNKLTEIYKKLMGGSRR